MKTGRSSIKERAKKFGGATDSRREDAIDRMLTPPGDSRQKVSSTAVQNLSEKIRGFEMGHDSSGSLDLHNSFSNYEKDKQQILMYRSGTVRMITMKFNEQIAANEAAFQKALEERDAKKKRYRKKKKRTKYHKPRKRRSRHKLPSAQSVWSNQMATRSFLVDPKTFQAPKKLTEPSEDQKTIIRKVMKDNVLIKDDPGPQQTALLHAFEPIEIRKGDKLGNDDVDDYFYIVQDGEIVFRKKDRVLATAKSGDTFGDINLVYRKDIGRRGQDPLQKARTIVAQEDSLLLRLKQEDYRGIVQYQAKQEDMDKEAMLRKLPFMNKLLSARDLGQTKKHPDAIDRIASVMKPLYFSKGDELYNKDDDTLYVIKEGNVKLTSTKDQQFVLGPSDYIGRQALMGSRGKEPEVKSLYALTSGISYIVPKSVAEKVLGSNYVNRETSRLDDSKKLDNFQCIKSVNLDPQTLATLAESVDDKIFQPHSVIMKQGAQVEPCLYIIREGTVTLSSDDRSFVREVGPGGYFGVEKLLIPKDVTGDKAKPTKNMTLAAEWNIKVNDKVCIVGILSLVDSQAILDNDGKKKEKPLVSKPESKMIVKRKHTSNFVRSKVELDDLEMVSVLGEGAFGEVWLVQTEVNGKFEDFALKKVEKKKEMVDSLNREIKFLTHFGAHPFIINMIKVFDRDDSMYMLMSLASGGELWDIVHREDAFGNWESSIPEKQARFYTFLLADTLAYIHSKKYVYRDLKMENVLIDADGYPVLIDFGFSKYCPEKTVSALEPDGTP